MRAKKLIILYAVVLFLVVFAVTFNCVCAIARFDVRFEVSSMTEEAQRVQARLEEEYGGKSYLFFGQEDVEAIVLEEGGGYLTVESFSKTFPNVIHAEVREKLEVLSVKLGDKYYAIDKDNTVLAINDTAVNNVSGNNTALYGISPRDPDNPVQVGEQLTVAAEDAEAFEAFMGIFIKKDEEEKDEIDIILERTRDNIVSMRYSKDLVGLEYGGADLYIEMREGVCVWIIDPLEGFRDKMKSAMNAYLGLGDAQRTYGYITVASADGEADYRAEEPPFSVAEQ